MSHPRISYRRAKAISASLLLIGLAILSFTNSWWPGILLGIGFPTALRQFFMGRYYDVLLTLVIFIGAFIVSGYEISWDILLTVLFIIGAIYILAREFMNPNFTTVAEDEEALNQEIEEDDTSSH